ncbi:MAG: formylglycine-generating enzyme family protein [Aliidongia sp.]
MNKHFLLARYWICASLFIIALTVQTLPGNATEATASDISTQGSSTLQLSELKSGQTFRECLNCPEMIVIPAGEFEMGSSSEEVIRANVPLFMAHSEMPQHHVSIRAFAIGKYAVTKEQFAAAVAETGADPKGCMIRVPQTYRFFPDNSWRDPGFKQTDRDPVVCVSWHDAQRYITWLNSKISSQATVAGVDGPYRLLTEAEWEYAARAGTTTAWFWGNDSSSQCDFANGGDLTAADHFPDFGPPLGNCRDGYSETAPVGSFRPNHWGLYDMVGNVYQWTADCWSDNYSDARSDGGTLTSRTEGWFSWWTTPICSKYVVRGAGWPSIPLGLRSAERSRSSVDERNSYSGFRVARSLY